METVGQRSWCILCGCTPSLCGRVLSYCQTCRWSIGRHWRSPTGCLSWWHQSHWHLQARSIRRERPGHRSDEDRLKAATRGCGLPPGAPAGPWEPPGFPGCCHGDPECVTGRGKEENVCQPEMLLLACVHTWVCVAHRRSFSPQSLLDKLIHEVGEVWVGASDICGDGASLRDHLLFVD